MEALEEVLTLLDYFQPQEVMVELVVQVELQLEVLLLIGLTLVMDHQVIFLFIFLMFLD
jgi:hypothetical protein